MRHHGGMIMGLPTGVAQEFYGRLAAVWGDRGPVLDIGSGSGVVAAELHRHGVPVVQLDPVDNRGDAAGKIPYLHADGCALPFRRGSCAGVHLARVLAHVPDWRRATAEAVRVLAPGGAIAVDLGDRPRSGPHAALTGDLVRLAAELGLRESQPPGDPLHDRAVDGRMGELGCGDPELIETGATVEVSLRETADGLVRSRYRWAPGTDHGLLAKLADQLLAGLETDPDAPVPLRRSARYRVYRMLPAG
ncbi:class I SAM-dependent methyltransferase [Pseudonocardiaceae bacterium YIM PH 21723]|nr:class I SAM-dependent methyltransferase [Pseudonocardiaceae bacterium YIM PH 21723]